MDKSYEREIPEELIKGCHTFIIHFNYVSYADFLDKSRTKAIQFLQKNKLEITEIKFERNEYGLNDYRIITRKKEV